MKSVHIIDVRFVGFLLGEPLRWFTVIEYGNERLEWINLRAEGRVDDDSGAR